MSVESTLRSTLSSTNLPIAKTQYTGTAAAYLTFMFRTDPVLFASDNPQYEHYRIYVDLFAPAKTNTTTIQGTIKTLLAAAGYDYPTSEDVSVDAAYQHIAFVTGIDVYIGA